MSSWEGLFILGLCGGCFGYRVGCLTAIGFYDKEKWDLFGIVWRLGNIMGESVYKFEQFVLEGGEPHWRHWMNFGMFFMLDIQASKLNDRLYQAFLHSLLHPPLSVPGLSPM